MAANFAPAWPQLGTFNGKLYALVFKASQQVAALVQRPGVQGGRRRRRRRRSRSCSSDAKTLKASGTPAYSIGGADGWTLTDLFENIYLRTFGPAKYNALSGAQDQVDRPVRDDGAEDDGAGRRRHAATSPAARAGALQNGFNDSVTNAFSIAAEGRDGVRGRLRRRRDHSRRRRRSRTPASTSSPFPSIKPGANADAVEIGGDLIVTFRDTPAIEAFVKFLATAAGGRRRGRSSAASATGNKNVPRERLPGRDHAGDRGADRDRRSGRVRHVGRAAGVVRRARPGQGEWGIFQDFLKNPSDVSGHPAEARERPRRRRTRRASSALSAGGITAEPPVVAAPPPAAEPRPARRATSTGALFLAPALVLLGVWMVYPADLHDRPQLLRPARLPRHLGRVRQLQDALHDVDADDRDQEQRDLGRRRARVRDGDRARSSPCSPSASAGRSRSRRSSSCRWRSRRSRPA